MSVVGARAHFVVTDSFRERIAAADRRESRSVTVGSLADASCRAFCGPQGLTKGMNSVQRDIHRRSHVAVAQALYEEIR